MRLAEWRGSRSVVGGSILFLMPRANLDPARLRAAFRNAGIRCFSVKSAAGGHQINCIEETETPGLACVPRRSHGSPEMRACLWAGCGGPGGGGRGRSRAGARRLGLRHVHERHHWRPQGATPALPPPASKPFPPGRWLCPSGRPMTPRRLCYS